MRKLTGLVLLLAGGFLLYTGYQRQSSLEGRADTVTTNVANAVDGGVRTPAHQVDLILGFALAVAGIVIAVRPGRAAA